MTILFPVLMTVLASIAISAFGASSSLEIVRILQAYFEWGKRHSHYCGHRSADRPCPRARSVSPIDAYAPITATWMRRGATGFSSLKSRGEVSC